MDDQAHRGPRPDDVEPAGLTPVRAFFVVGAVLVATVVGFLATREPTPATPTAKPSGSPDYSLTDAEAIAEFERLHELQVRAYETRDLSLIPLTYTNDSPLIRRVEREIRTLLRKRVTTKTNFATRRVNVSFNTAEEVVLHQTVLIDAEFLDPHGQSVAVDAPQELQVIRWTLRRSGIEWLIHDAEVLSSRPMEGARE